MSERPLWISVLHQDDRLRDEFVATLDAAIQAARVFASDGAASWEDVLIARGKILALTALQRQFTESEEDRNARSRREYDARCGRPGA